MIKILKTFIIVVIVLVIGIFAFVKFNQEKIGKLNIEELLKMTESLSNVQQETYSEIKEKLTNDLEDYSGLLNLAKLKQDVGDYDDAVLIYNNLRPRNPNDILVLNNLGGIYYNTQQYDKSEETYLEILSISPKWINSYEQLFEIYRFHLKDKKDGFEKVLLAGLEKYPEMKVSLLSLTAVYYDELMDNKEKAIQYYEELLKVEISNQTAKDRLKELKTQ